MKTKLRSFTLILLVCLCLATVGIHAENWSDRYYRVIDTSDSMTETEQDELDQLCIRFLTEHETDLAIYAISSEERLEESLAEFVRVHYENCEFGYGAEHDGFMLAYERDTRESVLLAFGAAERLYSEQELASIREEIAGFYPASGMRGMVNEAVRRLGSAFGPDETGSQAGAGASAQETHPTQAPGGMPYWYPEDTQHFTFFSDPYAPRVVDDADIFSDADEAIMEARLAELRRELDRDIVVFTDNSTHGLSRAVYAADFYDFNGYGIGEEREGFCLFICMEEGNRGFWTCGTGSDSKSLQTETVANALDDVLYEYMASGEYAEGVKNWIENIRTLYRTGIPFAPDWYPERGAATERTHNANTPRVYDELGLLSEAERGALEKRAAEIAGKYGVDIILHTTVKPAGIDLYSFMDTFYRCMGYGFGSDFDGIQATLYRSSDSGSLYCSVTGYGACAEKLSNTAQTRLEERCEDKLGDGAYDALNAYLGQLNHFLKTGRAPRSLASWLSTVLLGSLGGSLFGGIALAGAKRRMRTPQVSLDADAYIVKGGLRVEKLRDEFTGTTTSRRYAPPKRDSDGSSSSGHSSYSSSYSGSSGASHSGSGRSF
jgi:uncharacterized membrane protein YgcG